MLSHLEIRNLALIKEADLELTKGLTCITGETGAGKSLLIGAIKLLLGAKANAALLSGAGNLSVTGEFDEPAAYLPEELVKELVLADGASGELEELQDGATSSLQSLVIRRNLTTANRSRAYVNNNLVNNEYLQKLSPFLADIHSQNEQQQLLKVSNHLNYLDAYAGSDCLILKAEIKKFYQELLDCKRKLNKLIADPEKRELALQKMQAQLQELKGAHLEANEYEHLQIKRKKFIQLRNLGICLEKASALLNLERFNGDFDYGTGISGEFAACIKELEAASRISPKLNALVAKAETLHAEIGDFESDLHKVMQALPIDGEEYERLEARCELLNTLMYKYTAGGSYEDLLLYIQKLESKIKLLEDTEIERIKLIEQAETLQEHLSSSAKKLHDLRAAAADNLAAEMQKVCAELWLPNITFKVELEALGLKGITADGWDRAEFLMSANLGQELKPLAKVASGGESSRLFLALKVIFAKIYPVPLLIFDEIDQGLSGQAAQQVALKLAELGSEHQVLCISHQAQIVAQADQVIKVSKITDEVLRQTETRIKQLDESEILEEIMRLLGDVEDEKLAHNMAESLRKKI